MKLEKSCLPKQRHLGKFHPSSSSFTISILLAIPITDIVSRCGFEEGLYSASSTKATYDECYTRAITALSLGHRVIVDATFRDKGVLKKFMELAKCHGTRSLLLLCVCDEDVVKERLSKRKGKV